MQHRPKAVKHPGGGEQDYSMENLALKRNVNKLFFDNYSSLGLPARSRPSPS
jgi:hypothetical protein